MASQEYINSQTDKTVTKSLPRGLSFEQYSTGGLFLERYLGIKFGEQPKEVVFNLRNRIILLLFLSDTACSPKAYFLLGKRSKLRDQGCYHPEYHTLFAWQEDKQHLEEFYLHEAVHGFCYQPGTLLSCREIADQTILEHSQDKTLLAAAIERRIAGRFIMEGLATWGAKEALRRESLVKKGISDFDQNIRDNFSSEQSYFNSQDELLEKIVPEAAKQYHRAGTFKGRKREKVMENADKYLQYFWYNQGFIFVRDTLQHIINSGSSTAEAVNRLIDHCPQHINQIQDPFVLADELLHNSSSTRQDHCI